MASVLEQKPDPVAKYSSQVDEQIAQATSRIRVHDLMLGGLTLATLVAIYATAMILLDKNFNLSDGFRQLSLFGFGVVFGVVAYFMIGRPLRNRINPLYAAARVEETIEDAKNSVTGYVDAQERGNVHGAVRAAISAKAAKAVGEADVNHAVDHRNLLIVGGVLVVFLVTLAVLFFVFRPTQFSSLVGRAFLPFSPKVIATRTQIILLKPDPAEPTLSTGQTITVAVRIDGRIPAKTDPTRVRLLIRHNPADPTYEELPMQDDTSREWSLKVPEYLVQKGFWYKVAAGDAETPEYKVSVRSLPMFTDYDVSYEYPKYTRRAADKSTDPNLRAYRGTKITLLASANREVKDGFLRFTSGAPSVPGKLVAGKPNTLAFTFTATEATTYRLAMTTTSGDRSADVPPFTISLDQDTPPKVEVLKPEEPETPIPANGQLAVDGTVGDDFGIDKVRLCLRVDNRDLKPVMYEGGKSFRRDKDGTWPNDLVYKGSVEFTKLTFADGQKFEPKENMIVEFWLEAIDNCTETKPVAGWGDKPQTGQVGRSETRRVRLTPPKTDPEEKKQQDDQNQQRKNEEKNHNAQQQQKFDNEKRDPQQPQDQGQQPKEGEPKGKDGDPKKEPPKGKDGDSGMGNMGDPKMPPDKNTDPKMPPEGKKDPSGMGNSGMNDTKTPPEGKQDPKMPPEGKQDPSGMGNNGKTDPKMPPDKNPDPKTDPKGGMNSGMGNNGDPNAQKQPPEMAPPPKSEEEKKAEQDAQKVQDELKKNKGEGGDAKPNPNAEQKPEERQDPGKAKPQPMNGNGGQNGESKPEPKSGDPMGPKGENAASESKPQGNLEKPPEKSEPKPQPKSDTKPDPKNSSNNQDGAKGNPSEQRDEPLGGGRPGEEKPQPKKGDAPQKEPGKDPMSGSSGKPSTETKPGDPKGGPDDKQNPAENAAETKPNGEPNRGQDKKTGQAKPDQKPDPKQKSDPNAGTAKPEKAPPSAETKPPAPKEGTGGKQPDASEAKPEPKDAKDPMNKGGGAASETKPEPQKPMGGMGEEKAGQPGEDKPNPKDAPKTGGNNAKDKEPKGEKKLSDKERKELEDAANNLDNPDPAKRKDAQDKLDKAIGKEKRQELEQLGKDLKSDDPAKREAAEKKLEQLKKEAEAQAKKDGKKDGGTGENGGKKDGTETKDKGKELSPEEIAELAKKAGDLNSTDQQKREAAEKEFDKKLGKEAREKLQEELKKNPPMNPMDPKGQDDLKKQIEEQAKQNQKRGKGDKSDEFHPGGNSSTEPPNPEDPTDPKNKLKTAQLQLEEFEKNRYNKDLQDKLGWSQKDYDDFLKAQRERVKQMEAEQAKLDDEARNRPAPAGEPTIKVETGGKVESRPNDIGKGGTTGGAVYSPPGFEDARKKFAEELRKLQPKK